MFVLNSTLKTLILCKIVEQLAKLRVISFGGNILLYDESSSSFEVTDDNNPVALFEVNRVVDEAKRGKVSIKVVQNSNRIDLYKISARIGTNTVINYIDQNQNLISKEWFDIGYNFDEFGIAVVGKRQETIDGRSDESCYYSILKRDGTFLGPTDLLGVTSSISRKFGFIVVQLNNGNFNYVNMKTGELLLPETTKITRAGNFIREGENVVLARIEQYGKIGQQYVDLNGKIWNNKEDAKAGI